MRESALETNDCVTVDPRPERPRPSARMRAARLLAVVGLLVTGLVAAANPAGAAPPDPFAGTYLYGPSLAPSSSGGYVTSCYGYNCGEQGMIQIMSFCSSSTLTASTYTNVTMPGAYTRGGWYQTRYWNRNTTTQSTWSKGEWLKPTYVRPGEVARELSELKLQKGYQYDIWVEFRYAPDGAATFSQSLWFRPSFSNWTKYGYTAGDTCWG